MTITIKNTEGKIVATIGGSTFDCASDLLQEWINNGHLWHQSEPLQVVSWEKQKKGAWLAIVKSGYSEFKV